MERGLWRVEMRKCCAWQTVRKRWETRVLLLQPRFADPRGRFGDKPEYAEMGLAGDDGGLNLFPSAKRTVGFVLDELKKRLMLDKCIVSAQRAQGAIFAWQLPANCVAMQRTGLGLATCGGETWNLEPERLFLFVSVVTVTTLGAPFVFVDFKVGSDPFLHTSLVPGLLVLMRAFDSQL